MQNKRLLVIFDLLLRLIAVDVNKAGAAAVSGWSDIVRGRGRFAILRNCSNSERHARQLVEEPRQLRLGDHSGIPAKYEHLFPVVEEELRRISDLSLKLVECAVEARFHRDFLHLRFDALDLQLSQLMNRLGSHLRRGVGPHRDGVIVGPIWQIAHGCALAGFGCVSLRVESK